METNLKVRLYQLKYSIFFKIVLCGLNSTGAELTWQPHGKKLTTFPCTIICQAVAEFIALILPHLS